MTSPTTIRRGWASATCSNRLPFDRRLIAIATSTIALWGLLAATPAVAQGVTLGVTGGLNLAKFNASHNESLNAVFRDRFAPVFGLLLHIPATDSVSIQAEGLFSAKGSGVEVVQDRRIRLTYFEVPVLARYQPPEGRASALRLFAGPYAALLFRATSSPPVGRPSGTENVMDAFSTFDFGWIAGIGVGRKRTSIEVRYSGGITNISSRSNGAAGESPLPAGGTYRNRAFTFLAAYAFRAK